MFSFFGLFADIAPDLSEELNRLWPDCDMVQVSTPFCGLAMRFPGHVYEPSNEDLPERVSNEIILLSTQHVEKCFVLLRTECWGGECFNWGMFIRDGRIVDDLSSVGPSSSAIGKGILRRLMSHLGVDIGEEEMLDLLSRSYPWKPG